MSNDFTEADVRKAVFNAAIGRDPGVYYALAGSIQLSITKTEKGIDTVYSDGFHLWQFSFTNMELQVGGLQHA